MAGELGGMKGAEIVIRMNCMREKSIFKSESLNRTKQREGKYQKKKKPHKKYMWMQRHTHSLSQEFLGNTKPEPILYSKEVK